MVFKYPKFGFKSTKHAAAQDEPKNVNIHSKKKKKMLRLFKVDEHSTDMTQIWVNTASIYNKTMLHHLNWAEKKKKK